MCEGDNCCYRVARILLFVFTFIFVVTGIILLALGIVLHVNGDSYDALLPSLGLSIATLLIIIGLIVFIVAFFGCCGAMRQNRCLLILFLISLVVIFIMEIIAGIVAFTYRDQVEDIVTKDLVDSLQQYNNDTESAFDKAWNNLQEELKCCGVNAPTDWAQNTTLFSGTAVPDSCCQMVVAGCGSTGASIWRDGCKPKVVDTITGNLSTVAGLGIAIALFEILGMVFACYLMRSIEKYTSASV